MKRRCVPRAGSGMMGVFVGRVVSLKSPPRPSAPPFLFPQLPEGRKGPPEPAPFTTTISVRLKSPAASSRDLPWREREEERELER